MDHTSSIWTTAFNDTAELMLGISANDLKGLQVSPSQLPLIVWPQPSQVTLTDLIGPRRRIQVPIILFKLGFEDLCFPDDGQAGQLWRTFTIFLIQVARGASVASATYILQCARTCYTVQAMRNEALTFAGPAARAVQLPQDQPSRLCRRKQVSLAADPAAGFVRSDVCRRQIVVSPAGCPAADIGGADAVVMRLLRAGAVLWIRAGARRLAAPIRRCGGRGPLVLVLRMMSVCIDQRANSSVVCIWFVCLIHSCNHV
jgi:hypothetical protein